MLALKKYLCAVVVAAALALIWLPAALSQQLSADQFDFAFQKLPDGSEGRDVLIRSDDGLFVYAYIRKPVGEGPFPGVILIHGGMGGNLAGTRNSALKTAPANALLKNGYAVIGVDYRAKDWVSEHRDIVAGYEFFKALPYIQPDAIGLLGGSHGGKLALQTVTYIHAQAAVPCAGLFDLADLYEHSRTSEYHQTPLAGGRKRPSGFFMEEIEAQLGGTPEQVPEAYRKSSPISRVSHIETPVLVVHGKRDQASLFRFSEELVAEMKKQGKRVETFYAEKGPHGFEWGGSSEGKLGVAFDQAETDAFLERMLEFFGRHLRKQLKTN